MGGAMKTVLALIGIASLTLIPTIFHGAPTVYPTGTTIYKPDKCWNGYTIYQSEAAPGAVLIDMNGNTVRNWEHVVGFPVTMLPGRRYQVLQPLRERGTTPPQWEHAHRGNGLWTHFRGDARGRDRLGIPQSLQSQSGSGVGTTRHERR